METKCMCGYISPDGKDFIWAKLKDKLVLLCFSCSDKLHKNHIARGIE